MCEREKDRKSAERERKQRERQRVRQTEKTEGQNKVTTFWSFEAQETDLEEQRFQIAWVE